MTSTKARTILIFVSAECIISIMYYIMYPADIRAKSAMETP